MTDISMNSKKFNMGPGNRELVGEYKKTIIVVVGKSRIGKSTLCSLLLNDTINYISLDGCCKQEGHNIKVITDYVEKHKENPDWGQLGLIINDTCRYEFMSYFFEKYIVENENKNILLDGFLLSLVPMFDCFMERCKVHNFRVWRISRVL